MDHQFGSHFIGYRSDLSKEMDQVGPQLFGVDILVAVERLLELRYRKTLLRAGQPCDHVAGEQLFVCIAHFGIAAQCLSFVHVRILFLSTGTLEDEQVESHESRPFETQRFDPSGIV